MISINRFTLYIKNAGLYFFSSLFVAFVGILLNPIMAMNLSPEDYAIIGYYTSFNSVLLSLLSFRFMSYYARQYYFISEDDREKLGNTILLSMNILGFCVLLLFTFLFYVIYNVINIAIPFFPYAIIVFFQVFIGNIVTFYLTKLRIEKKAKKYAFLSISQCLIQSLLAVIVVVYYQQGALGKLMSVLITSLCFAIYSFRKIVTNFEIDKVLLKAAFKFGLPLTISSIFWYFLSGIDRIFLERTGDISTLGIYSVGLSIVAYMQIFYTTLSSTFEPDIYQSIAQKKNKKLFGIIFIIIFIVAVFNVVFILCAPFIIDVLTAGRYINSTSFAQILALSNITMAIYYMINQLLVGYGFVNGSLFVRVVGALCSVCVFYILIQEYRFIGAAWGQVLSFAMLSIIGIIYLMIKKKNEHSKKNY